VTAKKPAGSVGVQRTLYFLSLMLTAIAMLLAPAHLFLLPNKIEISALYYLIMQRNYDNWR
jgi:hypothetical protein